MLCRLQFTPRTYCTFLALYTSKLRGKARQAGRAVQRLRSGRQRLQGADAQVAKLRTDLQKLTPLVSAKSKARLHWQLSGSCGSCLPVRAGLQLAKGS